MYTLKIKLNGMLVSVQFLFWLYLQNWAGAALLRFWYLKMALLSLIRAQNSCGSPTELKSSSTLGNGSFQMLGYGKYSNKAFAISYFWKQFSRQGWGILNICRKVTLNYSVIKEQSLTLPGHAKYSMLEIVVWVEEKLTRGIEFTVICLVCELCQSYNLLINLCCLLFLAVGPCLPF